VRVFVSWPEAKLYRAYPVGSFDADCMQRHFSSPPPRTLPSLLGGHGRDGGIAGVRGRRLRHAGIISCFMACSVPNSTLAIFEGTSNRAFLSSCSTSSFAVAGCEALQGLFCGLF
jgi:hypothetical protein